MCVCGLGGIRGDGLGSIAGYSLPFIRFLKSILKRAARCSVIYKYRRKSVDFGEIYKEIQEVIGDVWERYRGKTGEI